MKKLFLLSFFVSFSSFATCMFIQMEEAGCSAGNGSGGPKTVVKGADLCPGKNKFARCQNQNYLVNGKSYSAELKIDHQGNVDWCGYVKCSAPPTPTISAPTGTAVQVKQDRATN